MKHKYPPTFTTVQEYCTYCYFT
ncbi:unnamed protein product, partial [Rotaria socialis]